ncbi:MAG: nonribosomal peptide synthetase [Lysinibacillus sp.]
MLCNKLQQRIHYFSAVYRKSHDQKARTWITFDGKEILSAADLTYFIEHETRYTQLQQEQQLEAIPSTGNWHNSWDSPERIALHDAYDEISRHMLEEGKLDSYEMLQALLTYPQLSIEKARKCENPFIRALTYFDKRTGKRTLLQQPIPTHPIEQRFYAIRYEVENKQPNNL